MSEIQHDPASSRTGSASLETAASRSFPFALAVDSSDVNLDALQRLLAARGIGLLRAHSAANGVALAKHHVPDVIIADLSLRGLSTLDFLVAAKSDARLASVPFIVGSVAPLHADHARRHCLSLGADGFIYRTPRMEEFVAALFDLVPELIGQPRPAEAAYAA